ncbi:hypothetical protein KH5_23570 [Urechidicola sp. KH5]
MEYTPFEMENPSQTDPNGVVTFVSQVFECPYSDGDFAANLDNDLYENEQTHGDFKRFIIDYVKRFHRDWAEHPRFRLINNTVHSSATVYSSSVNGYQAVIDLPQTIVVDYWAVARCPIPYNNNSPNTIGQVSTVTNNSNNTGTSSTKNGVMYDSNGLPTTPEIEAMKRKSQAEYNRNVQMFQAGMQTLNAIGNMLEQNRQRRLAFEREQRQKEEMEEQRKIQFNNQARQFRKQYNEVISSRQSFLDQVKLKSTLGEDGTVFKPLYIYFAYVPKDYDYYYERVNYPNILKFEINENTQVQFSQVFAFFPYSNGQYPFIEDIKKQIIREHFGRKANDYETVFFNGKIV